MNKIQKKGQVTIFVIIAIVLVAGIGIFFAVRGGFFATGVPAEFSPIYNLYSECIEQETKNALSLLGTQGGKIDVGEYSPGSEYSPFSSHLNFLGVPIPYWYYVSGNNLIKEQIPTKREMENELVVFLEERINECDFEKFYEQGFYVDLGTPEISVEIEDLEVSVSVSADVLAHKEERSARKTNHEVIVNSQLGKFYKLATEIYDKEKEDAFLEEYAIDVLRLNAPVDGVEVQCSPAIWKTQEVVDNLRNSLESNFASLKFEGNYYDLNEKDDEYFVINQYVDEPVNLLYLADAFPSKIEITPASEAVMMAEPVGNQEGMGIMGFCYVPYHFVYDVSFPVLVQIGDGIDMFQFPLSVIIDNNLPRVAELSGIVEEEGPDVCGFREGSATIYTYNTNLNPVEADISYECFDNSCYLGKTEESGTGGILETEIPLCVNGYLVANAEGYAQEKILFSSNSETVGEIILEREYEVEVDVKIAGRSIGEGTAVIHFAGDDGSSSAVLPESPTTNLKEGLYDVSVYVYGESGITIPSSQKTECYEVSRGGIAGFFGSTKEECVDIEIPAVNIDYALIGGGKTSTYLLESELERGILEIEVSELPKPTSMEQLQYNYEVFNSLGVDLNFE